jgi:hypothetical protein
LNGIGMPVRDGNVDRRKTGAVPAPSNDQRPPTSLHCASGDTLRAMEIGAGEAARTVD